MQLDWEVSPVISMRTPLARAGSSMVGEAIEVVAAGGMVIVVDDDDRENEGDLIASAATITHEMIAFMVNHSTGILCAAMDQERADALALPPMVSRNDDPQATAFTVTCDAKHCGTGVSAKDRAITLHALATDGLDPGLLRRPGHIFPLRARQGGVLTRQGHTEAAYDLVRLAGHVPVGVLCELVNSDGTMMCGEQIDQFSSRFGLLKISVADLIAWRHSKRDH
ncbi:3,4-dihydroxy 2-butanone 4-phosphate synthase / GTP cyclohydrolase II [Agrobacterium fabrum]|uniref:3,4-dihydroxy-2-butanone 4-phosphate synthase n=1 Tax=Agrobacterium fabrum TaxID=1176649 RepID=A0A7Z7FS25_9HYPH|nr:3,4-dihydroxy-2-butanone-4-phosphate synthase [Agrobacterium fabrum]SDK34694.1 3,4-dihydroxy 2-butanone 4-phosphate synthase / GTP cyclohydrolase II [Agrobacterium fabrum]